MKWLSLMPLAPPTPTNRVLVVVGHADDFVRHDLPDREDQIVPALPPSRFNCTGHGLRQIPSVASATNSAGTWPMVCTSFRQSWTRTAPSARAGNMRSNWSSDNGRVGAQGRQDVVQPVAKILLGDAGERPRLLFDRVISGESPAPTCPRGSNRLSVSVKGRPAGLQSVRSVWGEPLA